MQTDGKKRLGKEEMRYEVSSKIIAFLFMVLICVPPIVISSLNPCVTDTGVFRYWLIMGAGFLQGILLIHSLTWHIVVSYKHELRHFKFEIIEEFSMYFCSAIIILLLNYWAYNLSIAYMLLMFLFLFMLVGFYAASFCSRVFYTSAITDRSSSYIKSITLNKSIYGWLLFLDFLYAAVLTTFVILEVLNYTDITDDPNRPCNCPGSPNTCI